jgi:phosphoglycolate phosphatase
VTNRLAIFDCDGTLVDSQHSIAAALADAFTAHDLPVPPPHESRRVVGLSLVEAMAALLPGQPHTLHVALAETYKSAFQRMRARDAVDEPLFEGIAALLDALEADGWLLGVATGKSDRGLGLCLDCHGLAGRFVTLQTADRHPSKPHPSMVELAMAEAGAEPSTTLMIGDTSFDILMARAAGVTAIGVAWGYHAPQELWEAGAHHVAAHPLEVLEFAREQA